MFRIGRGASQWLLVAVILTAGVAAGLLTIGSRAQPAPWRWDVVIERHGHAGVGDTFERQGLDGTQPRAILQGAEFESAISLAWAPDGRRIAYVVGLHPDEVGAYSGSEVHVADADGSHPVTADIAWTAALPTDEVKRFDHGPYVPATLVWAPDSSMVAAAWSTYSCSGGRSCMPTGGI